MKRDMPSVDRPELILDEPRKECKHEIQFVWKKNVEIVQVCKFCKREVFVRDFKEKV